MKPQTTFNLNEIAQKLESGDEVNLSINNDLTSIEVAYSLDCYHHHYSDVAHEYLVTAYIGNVLDLASDDLKFRYEADKYNDVAIYELDSPSNTIKSCILYLAHFLFDSDEYDEIDRVEEFWDFEAKVFNLNKNLILPEVIDNFFANYIAGKSEWSSENVQRTRLENPEWYKHTWKSAHSIKLGFDLYVSPEWWVISSKNNFKYAIETGAKLNDSATRFNEITKIYTDDNDFYFITSNDDIVRFSLSKHFDASEVGRLIFDKTELYERSSSLGFAGCKFYISEGDELFLCKSKKFQYLFFAGDFSVLSNYEIHNLANEVSDIYRKIMTSQNRQVGIDFKWQNIDPEIFELMCYDLVCRDSRFDPQETKKMGKAHSSDGGRDILTHTIKRPGRKKTEKWIVQCKFSLKDKSLGRNAVSVSELILEYKPDGIIIITNMIENSTHYDKIEKIATNNSLKIECWDKLKLERMLAKHSDILKKFEK